MGSHSVSSRHTQDKYPLTQFDFQVQGQGLCFIHAGFVCFINCIIGLIFTMEAGNYWFDIFNDYAATLSLLLIVLVETIAVCYIYGLRR